MNSTFNIIYEEYVKQCSKHPAFNEMQAIMKTLNINPQQICDYDGKTDLHVGYRKGDKIIYITISA